MPSWIVKLQEGEESYPLYKKEKDGLIESLKRRAEMIEGVGLQPSLPCIHVYIDRDLSCGALQDDTLINSMHLRVSYCSARAAAHDLLCALCCANFAVLHW